MFYVYTVVCLKHVKVESSFNVLFHLFSLSYANNPDIANHDLHSIFKHDKTIKYINLWVESLLYPIHICLFFHMNMSANNQYYCFCICYWSCISDNNLHLPRTMKNQFQIWQEIVIILKWAYNLILQREDWKCPPINITAFL